MWPGIYSSLFLQTCKSLFVPSSLSPFLFPERTKAYICKVYFSMFGRTLRQESQPLYYTSNILLHLWWVLAHRNHLFPMCIESHIHDPTFSEFGLLHVKLNILCSPNIHPSTVLFVLSVNVQHFPFILQERFHPITKWTWLSGYETNLLPCHGMIVYIAKSGYYELSNIFLGVKWRTLQMSAKRYEAE